MKHLLLLALLVAFALPACAHDQSEQREQTHRVTVVGFGEIEAEPDQATLRISIMAIAKNLTLAKQDADRRYQRVLDVLKRAEIVDKDIKVARISMQPKYEWSSSKQVYKGEQVSRSLSIAINDLDKVSSVMQSLVENDVSSVDGLSTGFQNRGAFLKQALGAATADAKAKAEFLAERLDRNLGQAIDIVEQNNGGPMQQYQDVRMSKSASMVESYQPPQEMFGTQTISATVTVSFKLD